MSERIKAQDHYGSTILYIYITYVYTRFNQKHISCGFKSVVSQRPPPRRLPWSLRTTRITCGTQSLATPRVHRGLSPRPKVVSSQ